MNHAAAEYGWLEAAQAYVSLKHEGDKMIAFERAGLLFVFNFHPVHSYADYRIGVDVAGVYGVVLNSDEKRRFGGFDNVKSESTYFTTPQVWHGRKNSLQVCVGSFGAYIVHAFFCRFIFLPGLALSSPGSKRKQTRVWIFFSEQCDWMFVLLKF